MPNPTEVTVLHKEGAVHDLVLTGSCNVASSLRVHDTAGHPPPGIGSRTLR